MNRSRGRTLLADKCNEQWKSKQLSKEWEIKLTLPTLKTEHTKNVNHYHRISVLNMGTRTKTEGNYRTMTEAQSGFIKGKSIHDHKFTVRKNNKENIKQ